MAENQTISERIKIFRDSKGINPKKFERLCGLSNAYLDKVGKVGIDKLEQIFRAFPEINREWAISGIGQMLKPADRNEINEPPAQLYACRECKKKDEEIKKWRDKYDDMTAKYLAVLEEIKDKKVS